ncbi:DMT family transporter [Pontivivens ytuae]|uniref:DMT family transporter n=1 Tax=Pontivivens ytuae TaxID=2789856 RepID=A0A7S9QCP8_9RHOB|nr:DMT family transporter [Pontivivens ytuae]QPH54035.1 DMT family transporter [Pontivivens ytuae]
MQRDWPSYAAVAALTITWGSAFALTEVALSGFGPMAVVSGRAALAALVLVIAAMASGQGLPRRLDHWAWCAVIGITSLALPFSLLTWSQQHVESSVAAIFIATSPLFILVLARLILGTPIGPRRWVGFLVGFAGIAVLIGPSVLAVGTAPLLPQLALLGTAACYGFSAVLVRRMPELPPVQATAASQLFAAIVVAPLGAGALAEQIAPGSALIALGVLGLVQTGAAQLLRYWVVRRAGPVFSSSVSYLIPVWAGFLGVAVLGEPVSAQLLLGFVLILGGLLFARNRPEPQVRTAAASSAG